MKANWKFVVATLCAISLAAGGTAFAQTGDQKKPTGDKPAVKTTDTAKPAAKAAGEKPAAAAGQPSPEDMAKMMALAQPGEAHANLKPLEGKWKYVTKWRMGADQPWEQSTGKAEQKWILGGRILAQEIKGDPDPEKDKQMGGPFEGFGLTGYDNMTKKYFNVWSDNMGTGIMTSHGTADGSGKTFTYVSDEYICPMTHQKKTNKSITKIVGDDKIVFEMYDKDQSGKEFMGLEVTYTRSK